MVEMGIAEASARDIVDLVEGYEGIGIDESTEEELCKCLVSCNYCHQNVIIAHEPFVCVHGA